uniref:Uncharacterized protein n=1 Tax=Catagonus wagneri TaxID=51154 RepID=A0A8C3XCV4_9CETA
MRKFARCKVDPAIFLIWVLLDMYLLLYFNKCDEKKREDFLLEIVYKLYPGVPIVAQRKQSGLVTMRLWVPLLQKLLKLR